MPTKYWGLEENEIIDDDGHIRLRLFVGEVRILSRDPGNRLVVPPIVDPLTNYGCDIVWQPSLERLRRFRAQVP